MGNKLYVGNVPFAATNESLSGLFAQAGSVADVQVMMDKFTGRSRGFAFVTMATDAEARKAIDMLNGKPFEGRNLTVNEARPREERAAPAGGRERRGPAGAERERDRGERPPRREFGAGRRDREFDRE